MPPRVCLALVTVVTLLMPIVLGWGYYDSERIHAEYDTYHQRVEEENRKRPLNESALKDTVPQDHAFAIYESLSFLRTIVLAAGTLLASFVLCCFQRGSQYHQAGGWALFGSSALLVALYFTHW
jgi:hypothetical protein